MVAAAAVPDGIGTLVLIHEDQPARQRHLRPLQWVVVNRYEGRRWHQGIAYLRYGTGAYLDPWYDRLKDAYVMTTADLGVPASSWRTAEEGNRAGAPGNAMAAGVYQRRAFSRGSCWTSNTAVWQHHGCQVLSAWQL